jgi:hypothetical protein
MRNILLYIVLTISMGFGTQGILLVADQVDGVQNPQFFNSYYVTALIDINNYYYPLDYYYTVWDHSLLGSPTYADLAPYKVVIWFFGNSCGFPASSQQYSHMCLTPAEETVLQEWLLLSPGDRNLALFGMFAGWNTIADALNQQQLYDPLFSLNLALSYPDDNFDNWIQLNDNWTVQGVAGDPITQGRTYDLDWASILNYPDQLEPRADQNGFASGAWRDPDGNLHHQAIIRRQGGKSGGGFYKTALFACPLESFQEREDRRDIMYYLLHDWFGLVDGDSSPQVEAQSLGKIKTLYK